MEHSACMWRVKKWCSGLIKRKFFTNKEMSKCEIIFTGHRVHLVLELSLAKAGLKKRIRHTDLNILGILMFPAKLMGRKKP